MQLRECRRNEGRRLGGRVETVQDHGRRVDFRGSTGSSG
jgi:hypothetical protein